MGSGKMQSAVTRENIFFIVESPQLYMIRSRRKEVGSFCVQGGPEPGDGCRSRNQAFYSS
ncbi:hypothetical protein ABD80_09325 [Bacillus atrophaeus]|uniref:Uncharacterized protein n=1 Tax=Bacillus atrophaeus (strain 1942) TaxID=720555 RepID=A0ABM5M339_BACA1|nr:hypothetical protein BATR1942_17470 [Bacillus atrophaeus 1942]AMR60933.1 hypothetical protein A1D11_00340 [Bacillus subtilis subsp. globigii]EIM11365.1 hypothetical protein UY9_07340 [Bacillus atrophaeus C89]MBG9760017.1 hypothetical protein [Bacillus atrophaeus]MDR4397829.1 hypothetical protein [Bacillus atrophaeus]